MAFRVIYKQQNTPGNPGVFIYVNPTDIEFLGRGKIPETLPKGIKKLISEERKGLLNKIYKLVNNLLGLSSFYNNIYENAKGTQLNNSEPKWNYKKLPGSGEFRIQKENMIKELNIFLEGLAVIVIDDIMKDSLHEFFFEKKSISQYNDDYSDILYELEDNIVNLLYAYSHSLKDQEGGSRRRSTQRKRTPRRRKVVQTRKKRY